MVAWNKGLTVTDAACTLDVARHALPSFNGHPGHLTRDSDTSEEDRMWNTEYWTGQQTA